jgi:hypothetical protein
MSNRANHVSAAIQAREKRVKACAPPTCVRLSVETGIGRAAIDASSLRTSIAREEDAAMMTRFRNFLMLLAFAWWLNSVVSMDPLMLEWVAALTGA